MGFADYIDLRAVGAGGAGEYDEAGRFRGVNAVVRAGKQPRRYRNERYAPQSKYSLPPSFNGRGIL